MKPLVTSLRRVRALGPCRNGYAQLLRALGKTEADDAAAAAAYAAAVAETHGDNRHARDYLAAIDFVEAWATRQTTKEAA